MTGPMPSTAAMSSSDACAIASIDPNASASARAPGRAEVQDAEPEQQPVDRALLRALDRLHEVGDRLVLEARQLGDLLGGEVEDVAEVGRAARARRARDRVFSPRCSMSIAPRAGEVDRAGRRPARDTRGSDSASRRRPPRARARSCTPDTSSASELLLLAGAHATAIGATTSGITSPARRTTTVSPMRMSLRAISSGLCSVAWRTITPPTCTGSSTANGVMTPVRPIAREDVVQDGRLLLGRELVRDRPARRLRRRAEVELVGVVVDLHDGAVDLVIERVARSSSDRDVRLHVVDRRRGLRLRVRTQTPLLQELDRLRVAVEADAVAPDDPVERDRQRTARRDLRVLLAQHPGRGVARVREERLALLTRARR